MDIDCRMYTYDTKVNPIIKEAADKAKEANSENKSSIDHFNAFFGTNVESTREAVIESLFRRMDTLSRIDDPFSYNVQTGNMRNKTDSNQTETIEESLGKSMIFYLDENKLDKEVLEDSIALFEHTIVLDR